MEYWIYKNVHNGKYRMSSYGDTDNVEDAEKYYKNAHLFGNGYARVSYSAEIKLQRKLKLKKINEESDIF